MAKNATTTGTTATTPKQTKERGFRQVHTFTDAEGNSLEVRNVQLGTGTFRVDLAMLKAGEKKKQPGMIVNFAADQKDQAIEKFNEYETEVIARGWQQKATSRTSHFSDFPVAAGFTAQP